MNKKRLLFYLLLIPIGFYGYKWGRLLFQTYQLSSGSSLRDFKNTLEAISNDDLTTQVPPELMMSREELLNKKYLVYEITSDDISSLFNNPLELMNSARASPVNENDRLVGWKIDEITEGSLFDKMHLKNLLSNVKICWK